MLVRFYVTKALVTEGAYGVAAGSGSSTTTSINQRFSSQSPRHGSYIARCLNRLKNHTASDENTLNTLCKLEALHTLHRHAHFLYRHTSL